MNTATLREMPSSLNDACRKLDAAADEIERLQAAKRRALAMADERAKENVALREALKRIAIYDHRWPENAADIARRALSSSQQQKE